MHNSHEQDEARQPAPAELAQGRGDLALILAAGGLLGGLLVMEQQQLPSRALEVPFATLRLLLGLGYVFCAPGYLLQAALFPGHTELDRSERAGLSLGLSAALAPLLALALDRLPGGLRPEWIAAGYALLVLALLCLAAWRRGRAVIGRRQAVTGEAQHFTPRQGKFGTWPVRLGAAALLVGGLAVGLSRLATLPAGYPTEFYLLGPDGRAEGFPRQVRPGERLAVTLGMTNGEPTSRVYWVEVWAVDPWVEDQRTLVAVAEPFRLASGERRNWQQDCWLPWAGQDLQLEFLLFIDGSSQPYRRLLLWLDGQEVYHNLLLSHNSRITGDQHAR